MTRAETEGWLIPKILPALVKLPSLATVVNAFNCHRVIAGLLKIYAEVQTDAIVRERER